MATECKPYDLANPRSNLYGYEPSLGAGIAFSVLFALSAIVHTWQTIKSRRWWLILFTIGAFGEFLGWAARSAASRCVNNVALFEMQIALLIFSPAFTSAAIYTILIFVVAILGRNTSPLKPRLYLWIFVLIDFVSLLLQAIGGGMAASAAGSRKDPKDGTNIMISGIIFQLVSLCIFTTLLVIVVWRGRGTINKKRSLWLLCGAAIFSVVCMIIRGVYRSVELLQGWTGYLMLHEEYQIALDGTMIVLSLIIFNIFNPGVLLSKASGDDHEKAPESENQS